MKKGDKATFVADVFVDQQKIAEGMRLEGIVLDILDEHVLILLSPGMLQIVPLDQKKKRERSQE